MVAECWRSRPIAGSSGALVAEALTSVAPAAHERPGARHREQTSMHRRLSRSLAAHGDERCWQECSSGVALEGAPAHFAREPRVGASTRRTRGEVGARGTLGDGVGRAARKSSDRVPAVPAHAPGCRDQSDAIELALRGALGRLDRVQRSAKKMCGPLYAGAAYSHHRDDFALEVGQLRCEIGGACDPILQRDEIIWARVLCDHLGRNVLKPDTRAASNAKVVATFATLAQQHPRGGPESAEQVLLGDPSHVPAHPDARLTSVHIRIRSLGSRTQYGPLAVHSAFNSGDPPPLLWIFGLAMPPSAPSSGLGWPTASLVEDLRGLIAAARGQGAFTL